ncbi:MAG TPA: ABC transporter permease [Thiotrichaceae bacterium]|nr:ABC transporter permease [Thiotrichaceae bacterium]
MPHQRLPKTTFSLLFSQWIILIQRNFHVFFADKLNLSLIILQVPLIAMLIIVAFYNFDRDKQNFDEAARILYYFGVMKEPLKQADKTINIDKLHRYAKKLAQETDIDTRYDYIRSTIEPFFDQKKVPLPDFKLQVKGEIELISDLASMRRGSVYFLLIAASIWFGIMGSCKEIVTEQPLLKREIRSYLFMLPYLSAKVFVLSCILCLQTGLLSIIVVPKLLELSWNNTIEIWLILWIAAFVSAALGLLISCIVSSYRVALTLVPLLMIPQLLFGGLLRPQVDLDQSVLSQLANGLSAITIQRWAFESILTTDPYAKEGILKLQVNPKSRGELELVEAKNTSLVSSFFKQRHWGDFKMGHLWPPLFYLLSASLVFLIGGYIALRWRFT